MRMPQIRIEQTWAQIGIQQVKPKQEIQQPQAELNLHQEPAVLTIERTPSRLEIDQTQVRNELNLKDMLTLTRDIADDAYQQALEGIARRAQEGDRLGAIEQGGNPVAAIAMENTTPGPFDFNVGFIPSYGAVKMNYTPADLRLNWERHGVTMDPKIHKPIHEYTPGKVDVYLRQKESLKIDFVGGIFDQEA